MAADGLTTLRSNHGPADTMQRLAAEDAAGNTWLSYNDPSWLAQRHALGREVDAPARAMAAPLAALAEGATGSP
jgi:hypothetical protein